MVSSSEKWTLQGRLLRSSHTLYQKIDTMDIGPPWKNGFVDFQARCVVFPCFVA